MPLNYQEIFERNEKWIAEKLSIDPDFFTKMSEDHKPDCLFIGCSDSRADPEEITGLNMGQIFVHRNISNIVNPIDLNVKSVIEYAIENLNVKHIIVCGHYGCGGIAAAMKQEGIGKNSPWLQIIKDIYRIHKTELEAIEDEIKRYDRLVELNVLEQCENVLEMDSVKTQYATKKIPAVYGWVYDMRTGKIIDLKVDYKAVFKSFLVENPSTFKKVISKAKNIFKK
ncbi:MAG: carbonic anhydrase [Chitinophagales bacterium]|nr:carbonic anhydrase [Chitinophagales bacterium]